MALTHVRAELERTRAAVAAAAPPSAHTPARSCSPRKGARRFSYDATVRSDENASENAAPRCVESPDYRYVSCESFSQHLTRFPHRNIFEQAAARGAVERARVRY